MLSALISAGLLWCTAPAASASTLPAPAPTVLALRAPTPLRVDGILDEAAWAEGPWYSNFQVLDLPGRPARVQTRFKVRFDDRYIYLGIQADEPQPDSLRARITRRDGKVFHDDCVEVMLDPTGERTVYYHFIVNPRGVLYDAQCRQGGYVSSPQWNSTARAAVHVDRRSWSVELSIPLIELGLSRASTGEWALDVARERRVSTPELSTYVPLTGGFHQPAQYAPLHFSGADFSRLLWEVSPPRHVRVHTAPHTLFRMEFTSRIRNAGSHAAPVAIRARLHRSPGKWFRAVLTPGRARELQFAVPVAELGEQNLTLEIASAQDTTLLLARKTWPTDVRYRPLVVHLLRPAYRGNIYATQRIDTLIAAVGSDLDENELSVLQVRAALTDSAGEVVADTAAPAMDSAFLRLALPALSPGSYDLTVQLQDLGGAVHHVRHLTVRKLPRVPEEWRLDSHGILLHNGRSVLPFGWFSMPPEAGQHVPNAYNVIQSYDYSASVDVTRKILDRAAAAGLPVALYPYPGGRFMRPDSVWSRPLSAREAAAIRARVRALKDHPGLFAWYMADEPELRPALPRRCEQIYQVVRDEDPYHPCIMLNDTMEGIRRYAGGGDVLMPDPYPCFLRQGHAAQPLEKVGRFIQAAASAAGPGQAVWITPQGFNYGDYGKKNQRAPNFLELRNMVYQAVIHGARGFLWYTWSATQNYPDLGLGVAWLSREVADLEEAIFASPVDSIQALEAPEPAHMDLSLRRVGQDWVLFAVNTARRPQEVAITLPASARGEVEVVSEARRARLDQNVLRDHFDAYATHIYTTRRSLARRDRLTDVEKRIAAAQAARRKPGNLAFEDHGTQVEVSSRSTYGSTPGRVVDGITGGMIWRDGTPGSLPDWLTLSWPQPVRVHRVVVYSPTVTDVQVQIPSDAGWRTAGAAAQVRRSPLTVTLDSAVETRRLRLLITGLRAGSTYSIISEVEVYAQ